MTQEATGMATGRGSESTATDFSTRVRHQPGVKLGVTLFPTEAVVEVGARRLRVLMPALWAVARQRENITYNQKTVVTVQSFKKLIFVRETKI